MTTNPQQFPWRVSPDNPFLVQRRDTGTVCITLRAEDALTIVETANRAHAQKEVDAAAQKSEQKPAG